MVDILKHYGIKGMKWGVRRKRGSDGRVSKDYSESRKLLKKRTSSLSNEDIRKINKRLNLEQNLSRMDPTDRGRAKRIYDSFMKSYGQAVITGVATASAAATINWLKSK